MKDEDRIGKTYRIKRGASHTLRDEYIGKLFIPKTLRGIDNGVRRYEGRMFFKEDLKEGSCAMFYADELEPLYAWKKL